MTAPSSRPSPLPIPASAGIGFRRGHEHELLAGTRKVAWVEVHSENYFAAGGRSLQVLCAIRERYDVSLHGVGLSLGSIDPLDQTHLSQLEGLIRRIEPAIVSEHVSWGAVDGRHTNDLLPLPYTEEALKHLTARLGIVCARLGREVLIENVSSYVRFVDSTLPEHEFLVAAARSSGCRLLLDVNNVYVNARNHGFDPRDYLEAIPGDLIAEIHLAGHSVYHHHDRDLLIDTHGSPVCDAVWELYRTLIHRIGPRATLIEWDTDIPPLPVLLDQAEQAQRILDGGERARAA